MAVDAPLVVRKLLVENVHEMGDDPIQIIFNGVVITKADVKERLSDDVDVSLGVEYESVINFGIRHASSPRVEGTPKRKKRKRGGGGLEGKRVSRLEDLFLESKQCLLGNLNFKFKIQEGGPAGAEVEGKIGEGGQRLGKGFEWWRPAAWAAQGGRRLDDFEGGESYGQKIKGKTWKT
ncbi:hypothetical protein MA16_Dca024847 [Dendrobium catenatum]|uniref:Uncharacterized protein n=1 Tax=Dendrobium catenatum TaxID=906689 RepID=A0A2I0V6K8_9ASPA|nr:hypothetical protein MA16_Dca024847 [Dendrobium catenatum]